MKTHFLHLSIHIHELHYPTNQPTNQTSQTVQFTFTIALDDTRPRYGADDVDDEPMSGERVRTGTEWDLWNGLGTVSVQLGKRYEYSYMHGSNYQRWLLQLRRGKCNKGIRGERWIDRRGSSLVSYLLSAWKSYWTFLGTDTMERYLSWAEVRFREQPQRERWGSGEESFQVGKVLRSLYREVRIRRLGLVIVRLREWYCC